MFARHTPTRMRGSGVVQSLKSLASKLHPQLPLSPKESQRLLTALTSSFRAKLDEAHPPRAQDENTRPKVDQGQALNFGHHAVHTSSVAFADKHLATVLTNPLLSKKYGTKKPALNLESAQREMEQNPDRDPISVLEEYHEKSAATIAIANFCLRTFRESLMKLSPEDRRSKVAKTEAGVRTLHWLWTSELYQTDSFVDNRALMGALVSMINEEGEDRFLWSWLRTDMTLGNQVKDSSNPVGTTRYYRYRWKDFMLRIMVMARWDNSNPATLNDVLDVFLKAVDIHLDIAKNSTNCLPLGSSVNVISRRIFGFRHQSKGWDVKRYDRYIESIDIDQPDAPSYWTKFRKAILILSHPRNPSPLPMYASLRESFFAEPGSHKTTVYKSFAKQYDKHPDENRIRLVKYHTLLETLQQLKKRGYIEESEWILEQIHSLFPEGEKYLEEDLRDGPRPPRPRAANRSVFRVSLPSLNGAGTS